jgi:hypothetical protein
MRQKNILFHYLEMREPCGESALGIDCVFHFSPQFLRKTFFGEFMQQVTLKMSAEAHFSYKTLNTVIDFNKN